MHSEQPWDTCRAGVPLGKADIHFITLQRQHGKDAADVVLQNTGSGAEAHLWEVTVQPLQVVAAVADMLGVNKRSVIPNLLPAEDVSGTHSGNGPASCNQAAGRDPTALGGRAQGQHHTAPRLLCSITHPYRSSTLPVSLATACSSN